MEHLHRRWIQAEFSLDGGEEIQDNCVPSKEDTQQAAVDADTLAQESLAVDNSEGVANLFLGTPTFEVSEKHVHTNEAVFLVLTRLHYFHGIIGFRGPVFL